MRALACLVVALSACAASADDGGTDELDVSADGDGGKADAAGELKVRTGDTSVWVTQQLVRRTDENGIDQYVLRGRTSRNLEGGNAFIIDDPYGDFAQRSPRTWEVTWPASYVRMLADGTNQFVALSFVHSTSRPDALTARVVVRPRLASFAGSSKIYLTAELTPVVVNGITMYRLAAKITGGFSEARATLGTGASAKVITATAASSTQLTLDLPPETVFTDAPIVITVSLATGTTVTKTVHLGLAVKQLGLTSEDAYEHWPNATCTPTTKSCLLALGGAALDTGPCGAALDVLACRGVVGVNVDDATLASAIVDSHARTGSTAFRADAASLVGADRSEQLQGGAEQTVEAKLEQLHGRWYLGTAARTTALTAVVDQGLAEVYAHPLDLVDAHAPVAGNVGTTRQVAADALLAHLAATDFTSTALGRSYEALVAASRAAHVASIGAFRTSVAVEPYPGSTTVDVLSGDWLGLHTEITIDRATGAATHVLVEID